MAFLGEDSISVVVSAMENGMTDADAARIGEIVKEQTGLNADQIKNHRSRMRPANKPLPTESLVREGLAS